MNVTRLFAGVCLALMLVADVMLFHANHEREVAQTELHKAQMQAKDLQAELDTAKSGSTGMQAAELASLRRQNEALTAKVTALQRNVEGVQAENLRLKSESQQNVQHLTTARSALELQQQHLQQQADQLASANLRTCLNNLRMIDAAKAQWALEKNKGPADVPTVQDLTPYLKDSVMPSCPDGGTYGINNMNQSPTCTIPGHVLPPE